MIEYIEKQEKCDKCGHMTKPYVAKYTCDECGKEISYEHIFNEECHIMKVFFKDSNEHSTELDFCNMECCFKYIKENKIMTAFDVYKIRFIDFGTLSLDDYKIMVEILNDNNT
jgi:DNA replicative helicase MCM subunit Mcm2 (Cdc46/Mcm family)